MMQSFIEPPICIAGLSYHHSGMSEFAALKKEHLPTFEKNLEDLCQQINSHEIALINTCNRLEIVAAAAELQHTKTAVEDIFNKKVSYLHTGMQAVRHFYRVVASLDSLVVGESEIVAQTKKSYFDAVENKTSGPILHRLFQSAFHCSKQVRTQTSLSHGNVSVVSIGMQLLQQVFGSFSDKRVLLLGAGDTAELALQHLYTLGCRDFVIANRTLERSLLLAERYQAAAISLDTALNYFSKVDIVISALNLDEVWLDYETFKHLKLAEVLGILDFGMPPNFHSQIASVEDVYLYSMLDLERLASENRKNRQLAAKEAELIVDQQVLNYNRWFRRYAKRDEIATLQKEAAEMALAVKAQVSAQQSSSELVQNVSGAIFHQLLKSKGII